MAKATATEIEVTQKVKGIALELTEDEAISLRTVLSNSTTNMLRESGVESINNALKAAGIIYGPGGFYVAR